MKFRLLTYALYYNIYIDHICILSWFKVEIWRNRLELQTFSLHTSDCQVTGLDQLHNTHSFMEIPFTHVTVSRTMQNLKEKSLVRARCWSVVGQSCCLVIFEAWKLLCPYEYNQQRILWKFFFFKSLEMWSQDRLCFLRK